MRIYSWNKFCDIAGSIYEFGAEILSKQCFTFDGRENEAENLKFQLVRQEEKH